MGFRQTYELREDGIYMHRGRFRDKEFWDPIFQGAPVIAKNVYTIMEMVYNEGEHEGRKAVRNAIKTALNIDL